MKSGSPRSGDEATTTTKTELKSRGQGLHGVVEATEKGSARDEVVS